MESSAVMAMEYLVSEVKYLVKSGFERLKVMVKVERKERSLNSRCPIVRCFNSLSGLPVVDSSCSSY
jgi:hypothetical protein